MYEYGTRFEFQHYNAMDFGSYGLGATVNPMQNQLQGTNLAINWGVRDIEIGFMGNRWEGAPLGKLGKPEREEIIRLAEINKVNLTLHAEIKDPAGFIGQGYDELARKEAEKSIVETLEFADRIGQEMGVKHVPVTIHASNAGIGNPVPEEQVSLVDKETKKVVIIDPKRIKLTREEVEALHLPRESLIPENGYYRIKPEYVPLFLNKEMQLSYEESLASIDTNIYLIESRIEEAWNRVETLTALGRYQEAGRLGERIEEWRRELEQLKARKAMIQRELREIESEGRYTFTDEFHKDRVAETVSNAACEAFFKTKTRPVISIEGVFPEMPLSKPEDLRELVKAARQRFVQKLMSKGIPKSEAEKAAQEMIGITFDIGHFNLWKKYGWSDKDIERALEILAPYIKHVHITDNWGDQDSHLPVGWGNAPVKKIVEKLKRMGFKGKLIAETPGAKVWGAEPFGVVESMYHLGLPLAPGVPSTEALGSYFMASYPFTGAPVYPESHISIYGLGFSGLPYALGAVGPSEKSKFSGTPLS